MSGDVGLAISGSGFGLRVMAPCLSAAGFRLRVLHTRAPQRIEREALAAGFERVTDQWDSVVGDPSVAMACVAAPPARHESLAIAAMQAGKHLLCEKPLAPDAAAAGRIAAAHHGRATLAAVDHELRFHSSFVRVRDAIQSGAIGPVRTVTLRYATAVRHDPRLPWDWWSDATQGGGQLNALGSHMVDTLRWWLNDDVVGASGRLAAFTPQRIDHTGTARPVTADEHGAFHLQFAKGALASVVVSAIDASDPGLRVEIAGERGTLLLDGFERLTLARGRSQQEDLSVVDDLSAMPVIGINPWRTALVRYGRHLLACIRDGAPFGGATLDDGVKIQAVLDSVRRSAVTQ